MKKVTKKKRQTPGTGGRKPKSNRTKKSSGTRTKAGGPDWETLYAFKILYGDASNNTQSRIKRALDKGALDERGLMSNLDERLSLDPTFASRREKELGVSRPDKL